MGDKEIEVLQGTLDLLVLRALAWGPMHGYSVMTWLQQRTDGALQVEDTALYPALHRLENRGLIEAEWGLSENNRKAKFYHLTAQGRKELRAETEHWSRYVGVMAKVLRLAE
jgi:PadR family transcriptional regulator, regulatory protein PadR